MDALEEQRKRLQELRSKHVDEEIIADPIDRSEIEQRIREELEKEYEQKLKMAIEDLKLNNSGNSNNNVQVQEKTSTVSLPTTDVRKIKLSNGHILSLHDDCVGVWDLNANLIHNFKTYSKLNDVIFDNGKLIAASESGRIMIFTLDPTSAKKSDSAIKSLKTYTPIASIHKTSNTIVVVCKNSSFVVLAMNLVDELVRPTKLLDSADVLHVEFINDTSFAFSTLLHQTYIYNISDLQLKQIHQSKLPVLSLSYHSAFLFVLSLDRTITKIALSNSLKSELTCPILAFDLVAISGSSFLLSTFKGIQIYENEKLISTKKFKFDNPSYLLVSGNNSFYSVGPKIVNLEL